MSGQPSSSTATTFALVLAGGSGTRFWPLSRNDKPKQLLDLFGDGMLLTQTVDRLGGLVAPENILVLTNALQEAAVREALPGLPPENVVAEPAKRDTAPAVALGIGWVAARDPGATMMVLPADHLIPDATEYRRFMRGTVDLAGRTDALVTIGIKPTWPCPSYGYIERADAVDTSGLGETINAFEVARFREKPHPELAAEFLEAGKFSWNAGMFIWQVDTVRKQLAAHCPELAAFVGDIADSGDVTSALADSFPNLTAVSIDYALMEKADRVLNVEATFDWDDVGSWVSVARYLDKDGADNCHNCGLTQVDSGDNIVFSNQGSRIALLGVHDLIVVQTADAVLVADRRQADAIKKLVAELPKELL